MNKARVIRKIIIMMVLLVFAALPAVRSVSAAGIEPEKIRDERSVDADRGHSERIAAASLVRLGFSGPGMITMMDRDLSFYYDRGIGIFADYFCYRKRNSNGNGWDLYTRLTYRRFWTSDDVKLWQDDYTYEDNLIHMFSLDAGIRVIYGAFFLRQLWQVYALAAPRLIYFRAEGKNSRYGDGHPDNVTVLGSVGIIGGLGFEITFVHYLGMFFEFNTGYCPVGDQKRNVEGLQAYLGLTCRRGFFGHE